MDLPELNEENCPPGTELRSHTVVYEEPEILATLERLGESAESYRRDGGLLVPASLLLGQPIRIAHNNYRYETGVHVSSNARLHGHARAGETLTVAGRIKDLFERNGNKLVALDVSITGEGGRPVADIEHVSVYKLAARTARG